MRSTTVTLRIPQVLWDNRKELQKATGAKSVNAMFVGMIVYAFLHGGAHVLTNAIADLPEAAQDEYHDMIIKKFLDGKCTKGSFLIHKIQEAVDKIASGKIVSTEHVLAGLLEELKRDD